ncbi:uncharacterized protein LOC126827966 [Patella vulgata]|uniref:uncharacterized protein LOC126827966 n=1 Tax=Patella vulgata TaxID=6465 RepID=UPI00217FFB5E|nr:uncharacterized protein LOC126827966 [Patella vulgata]
MVEQCNPSLWNDTTEKLLLHIFKVVDSGKPQKCKWKTVALKVNEYGYNFNAEQCRLKVKSLKQKYDRNKKKMKKFGESPPSEDDLSEVESVFDSLPDMRPTFTIDSGDTSTKKKKNQKRSIDHMLDYLEVNFEKREAEAKKRHSEKMELFGWCIEGRSQKIKIQ